MKQAQADFKAAQEDAIESKDQKVYEEKKPIKSLVKDVS